MLERVMSLAGIAAIVGFCALASRDRARISWPLVAWGLGLQALLGAVLLLTPGKPALFRAVAVFIQKIEYFADYGAAFLFGDLAAKSYLMLDIASVIIFVSAVMSILYYLRVIPLFVFLFARLMQWSLRVSGAESLAAALFVVMGIEGVTGLKQYIKDMTESELFTVMVGFMATIAGTVMVIYVNAFGASAGHILTASLMSAPAAIMVSKMLAPETGAPRTAGAVQWNALAPGDGNIVEAASNGAIDGVKLAAFIGAMLLAFIAIIHMADLALGLAGTSFRELAGYAFAPVAFLLGVPWRDCPEVGRLLGVKVVFNEFLAYMDLSGLAQQGAISARAQMIATYALCSFANFGSLGILIGGIGGLAPERKKDVARLGLKALLAGMLAGFLTAAVAGLLTAH